VVESSLETRRYGLDCSHTLCKEKHMPHVILKMYPGRTDEQKRAWAEAVLEASVTHLNARPETLTIAIEEVRREDWATVVAPEAARARNWNPRAQ